MFTNAGQDGAVRDTAGPAGPGAGPSLGEAVALLGQAVDALAAVEVAGESDRRLLDGVVALQRQAERLAAGQVRALGEVERRGAFKLDGAASAAAWLRGRTRCEHGQALRQVQAARRLRWFPQLAERFAAGEVSFAHVAAVTSAAVPRRVAALAACEDALVGVACHGRPSDVRRVVGRIREQVDPDGSDSPPLDERGLDERRRLDAHRTIDGLIEVRALLDQLQGERLLTVLDAFDQPDPPDTPEQQRRSAGQRRADALDAALRRLLEHAPLPAVQGHRPQVVCTIDLETLLALPGGRARTARLRHTGDLDAERARRLARDATLQAVLTLGPWRAVNVGRSQRRLPAWLRLALEALHRHCRGPDCDRPISWTQAHHVVAWAARGETDLNRTVPLCTAHHDMLTTGGWAMDYDPDSGVCTWHGPHGQTIHTHPP